MTRTPAAETPLARCPQFFYWLSVDTKATSRILEKKPKTEVQQHTHGTTLTTATPAQTQEPQWNPEKTTTNSVLWACVVQAVNKSKKKPRRSWRGERNKGLEDLKIGHFFLIPYFHSHIIC